LLGAVPRFARYGRLSRLILIATWPVSPGLKVAVTLSFFPPTLVFRERFV